jgi:hypothetical protein
MNRGSRELRDQLRKTLQNAARLQGRHDLDIGVMSDFGVVLEVCTMELNEICPDQNSFLHKLMEVRVAVVCSACEDIRNLASDVQLKFETRVHERHTFTTPLDPAYHSQAQQEPAVCDSDRCSANIDPATGKPRPTGRIHWPYKLPGLFTVARGTRHKVSYCNIDSSVNILAFVLVHKNKINDVKNIKNLSFLRHTL